MLRGDPVSPELRWRDEEGVHRSPGAAAAVAQRAARRRAVRRAGRDRHAVADGARLAGRRARTGAAAIASARSARSAAIRPGYRPGASGGWRSSRGGAGREPATRGPNAERRLGRARPATMPGERFAGQPPGTVGGRGSCDRVGRGAVRRRRDRRPRPARAWRRRRRPRPRARERARARAPEGLARPGQPRPRPR